MGDSIENLSLSLFLFLILLFVFSLRIFRICLFSLSLYLYFSFSFILSLSLSLAFLFPSSCFLAFFFSFCVFFPLLHFHLSFNLLELFSHIETLSLSLLLSSSCLYSFVPVLPFTSLSHLLCIFFYFVPNFYLTHLIFFN